MRRNGGLWMVTLADCDPLDDEFPRYFRTRRDAQNWADEPGLLEWTGHNEDEHVLILPAPDDIHADDIEWEDMNG